MLIIYQDYTGEISFKYLKSMAKCSHNKIDMVWYKDCSMSWLGLNVTSLEDHRLNWVKVWGAAGYVDESEAKKQGNIGQEKYSCVSP